jgi:hypothetical protein
MRLSKMSVGDHADLNGKEIGDACEVREVAGDNAVSGSCPMAHA